MTDRLEAIRAKARRLAIADLARLALEQAERIAWLERDGKCQSMHKQDARIARLEAVVEAARERHDGCEVAGTSRCGVCWVCAAVNALDEEEGTDG